MTAKEIKAAIKMWDQLRRTGLGYNKAMREVLEKTGVNLRKLDFTPYREG